MAKKNSKTAADTISVSSLVLNPRNPRTIGKEEFEGGEPADAEPLDGWSIVVSIEKEKDAEKLFKRLESEGYKCKILNVI